MKSHAVHPRPRRNAGSSLSFVAAVWLLLSTCVVGGLGAPPNTNTPPNKETLQRLYRVREASTPVVRWLLRQGGLDRELGQAEFLLDRWNEVDVAVHTRVAWASLSGKDRGRIDGAVREARRERPSWEKTYNLVVEAIGETEELLARKHPKSRIRPRLVTILYTGYVLNARVEEPVTMDGFELFDRSRLPLLVRGVEDFANPRAPKPSSVDVAGASQSLSVQGWVSEDQDHPILISRHYQWISLVDPQLAKIPDADRLATEMLRRAPPTATICIAYEALQPAVRKGQNGETAEMSLEVAKHRFTCTPGGWKHANPN